MQGLGDGGANEAEDGENLSGLHVDGVAEG